ncbi:hypothetical protein TRFO_04725 [Tritrichomonas foetus]|uniref:Uncharacterized protein n=1 Tax=Tritrichomonas foetus TaxID=1144522 RepID=A0A1J4KDQ0_9EUKA|nr:hypothetical protein TRFO_04725 [Tritrichomonas foetus]|eukprot:OHT09114.1 hypothetical protein TRFO_04725 [Tritrichomonas foetus]
MTYGVPLVSHRLCFSYILDSRLCLSRHMTASFDRNLFGNYLPCHGNRLYHLDNCPCHLCIHLCLRDSFLYHHDKNRDMNLDNDIHLCLCLDHHDSRLFHGKHIRLQMNPRHVGRALGYIVAYHRIPLCSCFCRCDCGKMVVVSGRFVCCCCCFVVDFHWRIGEKFSFQKASLHFACCRNSRRLQDFQIQQWPFLLNAHFWLECGLIQWGHTQEELHGGSLL